MSSSQEQQNPEPLFVQPKPYKVHMEPGKEYYWCTCGQSKNQPFCDGSHRSSAGSFKPKKITVDEAKDYFLCGCKFTHDERGFCDGTHRKEEGIRKYNEFLLRANSKLKDEQNDLKSKLTSASRVQSVLLAGLTIAVVAIGYYAKLAHSTQNST